jgi:hypothetical protein
MKSFLYTFCCERRRTGDDGGARGNQCEHSRRAIGNHANGSVRASARKLVMPVLDQDLSPLALEGRFGVGRQWRSFSKWCVCGWVGGSNASFLLLKVDEQ